MTELSKILILDLLLLLTLFFLFLPQLFLTHAPFFLLFPLQIVTLFYFPFRYFLLNLSLLLLITPGFIIRLILIMPTLSSLLFLGLIFFHFVLTLHGLFLKNCFFAQYTSVFFPLLLYLPPLSLYRVIFCVLLMMSFILFLNLLLMLLLALMKSRP